MLLLKLSTSFLPPFKKVIQSNSIVGNKEIMSKRIKEQDVDHEEEVDLDEKTVSVKAKSLIKKSMTKKVKKTSLKKVTITKEDPDDEQSSSAPKAKRAGRKAVSAEIEVEVDDPVQEQVDFSEKVLYVKILNASVFKQTMMNIQNVVSEFNLEFIKPTKKVDDEAVVEQIYDAYDQDSIGNEQNPAASKKKKAEQVGGLRTVILTTDATLMLKVLLKSGFGTFEMSEPRMVIGLDSTGFVQALKSVGDTESIILSIDKSNRNCIKISDVPSKNDGGEATEIRVNLIEIPYTKYPTPATKFSGRFEMAADKFSQTCKQTHANGSIVKIITIGNHIMFETENDTNKFVKTFGSGNKSAGAQNSQQITHGSYSLEKLMWFSKSNKFCQAIEIFMRNEFPLVLKIPIAKNGHMYVFLTPLESDNL
jgi:hypothetical protein